MREIWCSSINVDPRNKYRKRVICPFSQKHKKPQSNSIPANSDASGEESDEEEEKSKTDHKPVAGPQHSDEEDENEVRVPLSVVQKC